MRRVIGWRWAVVAVLAGVVIVAAALWWRGRPERYLAQAEAALREDHPDSALEWLAVPEAAPATRERALLLRTRVAVERANLPAAVRALNQVNPDGPLGADCAFWRGRTLYAAGQTLRATRWFNEALKRRPDHPDTYRWLAAAAYDQGNRETAVQALETVTRLEPRDARAWRTLGLIFKESVEYERARAAFEKSVGIDGSQPEVRLELAETLLKLADLAGLERELAACQGRVPEGRHAEVRAECCRLRGDQAGFRSAVEAGLAAAPENPGLLLHRAQIELVDGHLAEAINWLDRAVVADPYRPEALYLRGVTLQRLDRTSEAQRDLARATKLNKGLAEMSSLNEQAEHAPHDADVRYRLGRLCVVLGKPELAASWYRAALSCDPNHAEARVGLNALGPADRVGGLRP